MAKEFLNPVINFGLKVKEGVNNTFTNYFDRDILVARHDFMVDLGIIGAGLAEAFPGGYLCGLVHTEAGAVMTLGGAIIFGATGTKAFVDSFNLLDGDALPTIREISDSIPRPHLPFL